MWSTVLCRPEYAKLVAVSLIAVFAVGGRMSVGGRMWLAVVEGIVCGYGVW